MLQLYCTVLYCTVLQVINTSLNFPIYWFVGNFREIFLATFCGWGKKADTKPGLGTLGRAGGNWKSRFNMISTRVDIFNTNITYESL